MTSWFPKTEGQARPSTGGSFPDYREYRGGSRRDAGAEQECRSHCTGFIRGM